MNRPKDDRDKALAKLEYLRRYGGQPANQWRGVGWFDVPGAVMAALAAEKACERRKINGHAPAEYRP